MKKVVVYYDNLNIFVIRNLDDNNFIEIPLYSKPASPYQISQILDEESKKKIIEFLQEDIDED